MHSISTRATTLGRRRNIAIVLAAAGLATAGMSTTAAFATTAPLISVQALSTSVPVGGTTHISLDIHNADALSVSLSALNLALACTTAGTVPCAAGIDIFKVDSITVDRHLSTPGPTACISDPATFSGTNPDVNSNTTYTNPNFEIAANSDCDLDIAMTAQNPVGASGATVFFSAEAVLNDSTTAANSATSAVASSQLTILPPAPVTPPVTPPFTPPHRDVPPPPPPANFTPPPGREFHRDAARCTPDTPNNGNGNVGYGNNGNGNVGNCNNGNGNTGDNNNGNGNGFGGDF